MELLARVKIENLFKSRDFKDKEGVVTQGKWKVQTFDRIETEEGEQMKLIDISVPDDVAEKLKSKIGEIVSLPVGTFVQNNRVGFYGLG